MFEEGVATLTGGDVEDVGLEEGMMGSFVGGWAFSGGGSNSGGIGGVVVVNVNNGACCGIVVLLQDGEFGVVVTRFLSGTKSLAKTGGFGTNDFSRSVG